MLSEKPWQRDIALEMLLGLFASICLGAFAGALAMKLLGNLSATDRKWFGIILSTLSFQGAALLWVRFFLNRERISWSFAFGFGSPRTSRALLLGIVAGLAVLPGAWLLMQVSALLMNLVHIKPEPQEVVRVVQQAVEEANPDRSLRLLQIFWAALAVSVVPMAEEIVFRGFLYPLIKQAGRPKLALWGTSLLFAGIHGSLTLLLPLTFLAVVLVLLYEETDNLLAPILTHCLFNGVNFLLLVFEQPITRALSGS